MNTIRSIRHNLDMTQAEFAEHCGISIVSVTRYEAGGMISRNSAEKIAKACNVTVDYVLGGEENDELILSEDEIGLIEEYRALTPKGKNRVRNYTCEMGIVYGLREHHG